MQNENTVEMEPSQKKFDPKIFLENGYCLCDDFSKILRRSKKASCSKVFFSYWNLKKDSKNGYIIKPFKFSDLWLVYVALSEQPNGEKGKFVVGGKLYNIFLFENENGLSPHFILKICFLRGQWCIASYTPKEKIDIGSRIFEKI